MFVFYKISIHDSENRNLAAMDVALIKIEPGRVEKGPTIMQKGKEKKAQTGEIKDGEIVLKTDLAGKEFEVSLKKSAIILCREYQDKYTIQPGDSESFVFDVVSKNTIQIYGMITIAIIDKDFELTYGIERDDVYSEGVAIHINAIEEHLKAKKFDLNWKGNYMHFRDKETTEVDLPTAVVNEVSPLTFPLETGPPGNKTPWKQDPLETGPPGNRTPWHTDASMYCTYNT